MGFFTRSSISPPRSLSSRVVNERGGRRSLCPRGVERPSYVRELRLPVSFWWVLVCLCQTHAPLSPDPLVTSRLQTVSGYLYPSQSQVPERPCLVHLAINMRYIGGIDALVGGRNLAWKFMVLECTSSMGSVTCTRLPTCLTDVGFGQRFT